MLIFTGVKTIEVDGLEFSVRPETYKDFAKSLDDMAKAKGDVDPSVLGYISQGHSVMSRIVGWKGPVLPDGSEAPCDDQHKDLLFGQHPELLRTIAERVIEQEAEASKNSETSLGG